MKSKKQFEAFSGLRMYLNKCLYFSSSLDVVIDFFKKTITSIYTLIN